MRSENNPNHHILYTFRRCPYAMRARMAIHVSQLKVEIREIVLRDKPEHMLEISPKGTVPVLLAPNGVVIDESYDVMIYALGRQDPHLWLEGNAEETALLIKRNDGAFKNALDRYKYPTRYPDEDCSDARDRGEAVLKDLNARIEKHGALVEADTSLADIAIFPFIRQFANVDREWFDALPYKALQEWLKAHLESDLFAAIMRKYQPWQEGGAPIYWPARH